MRISDWSSDVCSSDLWATRTRCGAISSIACIGLSTIRLRGLFVVTTILNHLSVLGHLGRFIHHSREINGAPFCQLLQYRHIRWRQSEDRKSVVRERVCQYV